MNNTDRSVLNGISSIAHGLGDATPRMSEHGFDAATYIGEKYVYKAYAVEEGRHSEELHKEPRVLETLRDALATPSRQLIPRECFVVPNDNLDVVVQSKVPGKSGLPLNSETVGQLATFLMDLHGIKMGDLIDEFEEGKDPVEFQEYVDTSPKKFAKKILEKCSDVDARLLEQCLEEIARLSRSVNATTPFVLLHKDITELNLLQSEGGLSGVVDWSAAQTGPPEWEIAIIKQRFPDLWDMFRASYGRNLNNELVKLCGLIQSLRFWKSFPEDVRFVSQQRLFINELLGVNR